jgi:tetratricopeptide (TPR) repeat protein
MEMVQRLEEIITATPETQRYSTSVCRAVSLWRQGSFEQALIEVEQSISLDPAINDAYFWKGMICASLQKDEEAMAAIARALELKLPPVLLTPLRWLDEERQDFCEKYVEPLLTRYNVLNHQEPGE